LEAHRSKINELLERQKELEKQLRTQAAKTLGTPLDQLSAEAAQKLEAFSRKLAMDALLAANREAQAICASDPGGAHRWNFGLYVFTEPNENPQRQRPNSDDQE